MGRLGRQQTPQDARSRAIRAVISDATLPFKFASVVRPLLHDTPEYEQARKEGRARSWLDLEAESLGYLLAETTKARLQDLDQ